MPPIRIAFIGLSATRGWATGAHLPYLQQTTKYTITGICNSSLESSEAAIKAYNLGADVKAYGSAEELAADGENFDLVVCSVWVNKHLAAVKPIIAKGKQCYVEWPLGKNLSEAEEMLSLAKSSGNAKTIVGLQARRAPIVNKVRSLVSSNRIGKILSVTVRSSGGNFGAEDPEGVGRLMNDSASGANMLSIHFGHLVDFVLYAVGKEVVDLSAIVSTQRPTPKLKFADGRVEETTRNTPDQILLQGHLGNGGVVSIHQRGGPPLKGSMGLEWRIYGEKGEIEVTSLGSFLQIGYGDDMHIKVHDHEKDEVEEVEWVVKDECSGLPTPAQNVGRIYEAFAEGKTDEYADWEEAVQRHRLLEKIIESSETGKRVVM